MKKLSSLLHPLSLLYALVSFAATLVPLLLLSLWERVGISVPAIFSVAGAAASFALMLSILREAPRVSTVFFSLAYAFASNTLVYATESTQSAIVILLFPLVMAGVHRVAVRGCGVLFALSLAATLAVADNLSFVTLLSSVLFFVYYLITEKTARGGKRLFVYLSSFAGGILISLPRLLPVIFSLDLSSYFHSTSDVSYKALLAKLFPAAFDTVGSLGTPFLYCGVLTLLFLPVFFAAKNISRKKKLALSLLLTLPLILSLSPQAMPLFLLLGDLNAFRFPMALPFVFFLCTAAEEGFSCYSDTRKGSRVLSYAATGTVLLALVAEKLKAEPPITASETARTVMQDPASVFITLFAVLLFLLGVHLFSGKSRKAGIAVLSVTLLLELSLSSLFFLPLATEECDLYFPAESETHTISHDYTGDILADTTDEMFYLFRDETTGLLGNVGAFGNLFGSDSEELSAFFSVFGAKYENGRLTGSTPVLDALCGITYTIGDGSGVSYGLSKPYGETKRKKPIYENLYVLPVGVSVQTAVLDGLPTHSDPFRNMNDFLTLLTGKETTVFNRLTPEASGDRLVYTTHTAEVWVYRNGKMQAVTVSGSLTLDKQGGDVYVAELDGAKAKEVLSELYTRSFAPHILENGHVAGNIFISTDHRLFLTSFPYSADFTVEVDGEETATRNLSGLLAVPIDEIGYHNVSLRFTPLPRAAGNAAYASFGYAAIGIAVTLLPLLAGITGKAVRRHKTKENESEDAVCKE